MEKEIFSAKKRKAENKKMRKEWMICIIVIFLVAITNIITQNYTNQSVETMDTKLENLKQKLTQEEVKKEEVEQEFEDTMKHWKERYKILAYYIEHDELEKVETELTSLKANIQIEQFEEGVPDLEKSIFILNHIKEKFKLNIKNVF